MLSLVYKDLLLQRGSKSLIYMLVMPVLSAFAFSSDVLYVILPYIAGSYLYIVYANALDDKYNAEKILLSMPIKRTSIVAAKYLGTIWTLFLFSWMLYPGAYLMPYLFSLGFEPALSEAAVVGRHITYTIADVSSKVIYGILLTLTAQEMSKADGYDYESLTTTS